MLVHEPFADISFSRWKSLRCHDISFLGAMARVALGRTSFFFGCVTASKREEIKVASFLTSFHVFFLTQFRDIFAK